MHFPILIMRSRIALHKILSVHPSSCITNRNKQTKTVIRKLCSHHQDDNNDKYKWRRRRVVITGMGAITPLGYDMESTWQSVLQTNEQQYQNGGITSSYHALEQQNLSPEQFEKEWEILKSLSCQVAASVPYEWISNHPHYTQTQSPPWLDGRTGRFVQLAMIAAQEAIDNSGLNDWLESNNTEQSTIGVSVGNGMSSTRDISMASSKSIRKLSPHFIPQILPNSPAARIAIHNNLHGPNLSHSEACAAGAAAVAQAIELIQIGKVHAMVAGGCESAVEALGLAGFSRLRALSTGSHTSDAADKSEEEKMPLQSCSRPFDSKRNGFILAEGAAMLVLEDYEHAIARGAGELILAEVLGVGYSGDAFHITAPEPNGFGAAKAMLNAVQDAGCSMNDVDYINTHATSTPLGDVAEINAIALALNQSPTAEQHPPILVSSTKGATGHLLGAAGALEAALTVKSISENTIPHTRNLEDVSEDITKVLSRPCHSTRSIRLVKDKPIKDGDFHTNLAMSNSFGFGGTNVSLLFGKVK